MFRSITTSKVTPGAWGLRAREGTWWLEGSQTKPLERMTACRSRISFFPSFSFPSCASSSAARPARPTSLSRCQVSAAAWSIQLSRCVPFTGRYCALPSPTRSSPRQHPASSSSEHRQA
eukprot:1944043-Rhodomonas_salina.1